MSPDELNDFLPGAPIGFHPSAQPHPMHELQAEMADIDGHVNGIAERMHNEVVADARPLLETHNELTGRMEGETLNNLSDIESVNNRLTRKLNDSAEQTMHEVYAGMSELGFPPPTMEQVQYGNITGDHLGSLLDSTVGGTGNDTVATVAKDDTGSINFILPPPPPVQINPYPIQPINPPPPPQGGPINPPPPPIKPPPPPPATLPGGSGGGSPTIGGACAPGEPLIPCIDNQNTAWYDTLATLPPTPFDVNNQPMTWPPTKSVDCPSGSGQVWRQWCVNWCQPAPPNRATFWLPEGYLPKWDRDSVNGFKVMPNAPFGYNLPSPGFIMGNPFDCTYTVGGGGDLTLPSGSGDDTLPGETCKPFVQKCSTPDAWQPGRLGPASGDVCDVLEKSLDAFTPGTGAVAGFFNFSVGNSIGGTAATAIAEALIGKNSPIVPDLLSSFGKFLDSTIQKLAKETPCDIPSLVPVEIYKAALGWLEKWFGVVPEKVLEQLRQVENYNCQLAVPSGSEADEALLANTINKETWKCWHKIEGNRIKEREAMIDAKRERVNAHELCILLRRKLIEEYDWAKAMRERGVMNDTDRQRIFDATQHAPGISDITQFMRHNIGDPNVVEKNQLDKDFDVKFSDRMRDYAAGIGVTDDQMKDYWRVHWQYPSYTQVTEMLQRLRPGRAAEDEVTTKADVQQLLETIDFAPAWVNAMIAISYRIPTREDATKSFYYRQISDDEYKERLQDVGYEKDNADFIYNYNQQKRELTDNRKAGWPALATLVRWYADCLITKGELQTVAPLVAENQNQQMQSLDAADFNREVVIRRNAITGISYQYRRGLIDESTAMTMLSQQGIDPSCVPHLMEKMTSQKSRTPKQLSASALCKMRESGIITPDDMVQALIRTGWSGTDAIRIAQQCTYNMAEKMSKAEARMLKAEQRAAEKKLKAERRQLKEDFCGPLPCPKTAAEHPGEEVPGLRTLDREINAMDANAPQSQ